MELRDTDVLRAQARFLSDYCGDDALYRWRAKLSDTEREQLAYEPNAVQKACTEFVEAFMQMLRALAGVIIKIVRAFADAFASPWEIISSRSSDLSGQEAF